MEKICFEVKKSYDCDVLVAGGGTAGISAAIAAAREGARVILCESGGFLGGTATKGLVGPFMTCYDKKGEVQIIRGIFEELVQRLVKEGGAKYHTECPGSDSYSGYRQHGHIGVTPFSDESLKRVAEEMCIEAGVRLFYHTTVMGADTADNTVSSVYAAFGADIFKISAKEYIDATGSSWLASTAGAETMRGNDGEGVQTASMFFQVDGIDKSVIDKHMSENPEMRARFFMDLIEKARAKGDFPCGTYKIRLFENPNGSWTVNMAQEDGEVNELDAEAITKAEISQRKQIIAIAEFLKKYIPGHENIRIIKTASDIGIRESRRIVGKSILTADDIMNRRYHDERIAVCANSMDVHKSDRVDYTPYNSNESYFIPLSSLISKNINNLMAAGKCVSADMRAFAAIRVMPPCFAMGQAAGITAAMAAKKNVFPSDVDVKDVQAKLLEQGAYLG